MVMATKEEIEQSIAALMDAIGRPSVELPKQAKHAPSKPLAEMSLLGDMGSMASDLQRLADGLAEEPVHETPRHITADMETGRVTIPLSGKQQPEMARIVESLINSVANREGEEKNVIINRERRNRVTAEGNANLTGRDVTCDVKDMDRFKADIDALNQRFQRHGPKFRETMNQLLSMSELAKKIEIPSRTHKDDLDAKKFHRPIEMRHINPIPQIRLNPNDEGEFEYSLTLEGAPVHVVTALLSKTSIPLQQVKRHEEPVFNADRTKAHMGPGLVTMTIPVGKHTADIFNKLMSEYKTEGFWR